MGFWTRPSPGVEIVVVRLLGELGDEVASGLSKTSKGGEGDSLGVEVELLVLDDLVSRAALNNTAAGRWRARGGAGASPSVSPR